MRSSWTTWLLLASLLCISRTASAAPSLTCAVEGMSRGVKAKELCQALAEQLGREVVLVGDAREAKRGEAVEIIPGDVAWTVVWLVEGRVRTWTRVSKIEPTAEQVKLVTRAARELAKQSRGLERPESACLRLDPNAGYKARSSDISYPWAELSSCKRKLVEVVDPWWLRAPGDDCSAP